ncbi:MAG: hypothetical protein KAX45_06740 [Chitinophagaceae bacterium]|nr:hypothetical protein [Chitinophagaceae bacterium]
MLTLRFAGKKMMAPLALFFLATIHFSSHQNQGSGKPPQKSFNDTALVTVGAILPNADGRSLEVIFNERAHVLRLSREEKDFTVYNRLFEASLKSKGPVRVITDGIKGNLLQVAEPSPKELAFFREMRKEILTGEPARKIELSKIDTATFNIVDEYLKWPVFNLCMTVVPSFAKAKEIFDYCAAQSCHIVGPKQVTPCIPFQYVHDGCYARAHKMRWIIEKHFGYCSEKVFSFATVSNHKLAVKADKWGGCCVEWWYHVTPLIRVKTQFGRKTLTLAYVIDPGMFNQPVLLSTWLNAQKSTTCNANATVDSYSIQPSSAYTPSYPGGTPYATDPNYVQTNAMLINYANGITCN